MTIWQAAVLGLAQGLTEFLPVSSSGHLVVLQQLFGITDSSLTFDVVIHLATLVAILLFFGRSLFLVTRREWWLVALGTIPAVIVGVVFKEPIEKLFANDRLVGLELIISGLINFYTDSRLKKQQVVAKEAQENSNGRTTVTPKDAILTGIAQAIAIIPGISRSGSTVATTVGLGITREQAFRFSFLLAIPALLGAGVLQLKDVWEAGALDVPIPVLVVGSLVAFISGFLSLGLFKYVIAKARLEWFGWYCIILGLFVLFLQFS